MSSILKLREEITSLLSKQIIKLVNDKFVNNNANHMYIDVFETIAVLLFDSNISYEVDDILKKYIYNNNITKYKELDWRYIETENYEDEVYNLIFVDYDFCEYIISKLIYKIQEHNYAVYSENMIFNDTIIEKGLIAITKNYPTTKKLH